jgi:hypothetical protein
MWCGKDVRRLLEEPLHKEVCHRGSLYTKAFHCMEVHVSDVSYWMDVCWYRRMLQFLTEWMYVDIEECYSYLLFNISEHLDYVLNCKFFKCA